MRISAGAPSRRWLAIGLVHHHALGEEAGERLLQIIGMAGLLHRAGEEARIEQMQDRMLDAADILIDRQPIVAPPRRRSARRCSRDR